MREEMGVMKGVMKGAIAGWCCADWIEGCQRGDGGRDGAIK